MATTEPGIGRTLAVVAAVALGAALLVSATYELSKDRIALNERQRLISSLTSVLGPTEDLSSLEIREIQLADTRPETDDYSQIFVMMRSGAPTAVVIASQAPDGYNAPISLLVGIDMNGVITGVRVIDHRETPGLGDAIEADKSDWIEQFVAKSLDTPKLPGWAVTRDGGEFDTLTGATVTPRAVVGAVKSTLLFFGMNRERIITAAMRARQEDIDAPEL